MKKFFAYILVFTIFGLSAGFFAINQQIINATSINTVNVIEEEVKVSFITEETRRIYETHKGLEKTLYKTSLTNELNTKDQNQFFSYADFPLYLLYESLLI